MRYNIFWFIIDSVRSYRTNMDDRDRLTIMDEFARDSIEFTNAFTSAPSSLLAGGALFTGFPAVYIARHFNDWKFADNDINSFATLVERDGYESYPLLNSKEEREKYQFLLPPFKSHYLPKGFKLSDYAWRNWEITAIFEHIMNSRRPQRPGCFTFWYDCRRDAKTSKHVSRALELIKRHGFYDNSIIIMNSDHGYPDPATNLNEGFFKGLGHDMILTDDNIRTPLLIRYPGCLEGMKVDNVVGHVDILPTVFDFLGLPEQKSGIKFQGKSMLPIIKGEEVGDHRIVRSDTRLTMDVSRITSLRANNYKYVYFYDEDEEALYNVMDDPKEQSNLIKRKDGRHSREVAGFRDLLKEYEKELYRFHQDRLLKNSNKSFESLRKKYHGVKLRIMFVSKAPGELLTILSEVIRRIFDDCEVDLIHTGSEDLSRIGVNRVYNVKGISIESITALKLNEYSIAIYLTENSHRVFLRDSIIKGVKAIPARHYRLLNYNFELFNYFASKWFPQYARLFFDWSMKGFFYKQEPLYFFRDIFWFSKIVISQAFRKNKNLDRVAAKEIKEFRDYHLKGNRSGLNKMSSSEMKTEFERIDIRGD